MVVGVSAGLGSLKSLFATIPPFQRLFHTPPSGACAERAPSESLSPVRAVRTGSLGFVVARVGSLRTQGSLSLAMFAQARSPA